jgi:hypothetical protein
LSALICGEITVGLDACPFARTTRSRMTNVESDFLSDRIFIMVNLETLKAGDGNYPYHGDYIVRH